MKAIYYSSCVHFIPVSVHKSFQSSSSTASTVDVDVDEDEDVDEDVDKDVGNVEDIEGVVVDVEVDVEKEVDVDVEYARASKLPVSSSDWTSSIRTGTFGRPPSIQMD